MVGTRPTRRPSARWMARQDRRAEMSLMSSIAGERSVKAVLGRRVLSLPNLVGVRLCGPANRAAQRGEALEEARAERLVEAEHIVQHQHLAIAIDAGPDTHGRYPQGL